VGSLYRICSGIARTSIEESSIYPRAAAAL
jgi:hypothetical protein